MKKFNKIFALTLIAVLMLTLSACGKDKENQNSKPDDTSKPTVSTPSDNNTTTESKPEENKQEESKPESKPESSTPSKPVVNKIPITNVIGKWNSQINASEILAENDIILDKTILINIKTVFGNDYSYCVSISPLEVEQILKNALSEDYDDDFINNCVSLLDDMLYESGIYKFENDKLHIMWDGDPDFTEVDHSFRGSKDKLTISFYSDERTYTRVK